MPVLRIWRVLAARLRAVPAPVQGALYMMLASLGFSVMNLLVRVAAAELHPFEIAFFRNFFAVLFSLPWLAGAGLGGLRTARLATHFWRGLCGVVAMLCWFSSIALLPLAEAVTLNFTVPLFATAGAALILGEVVRSRRWAATIVGFMGVLIVLRPGFTEITPVTGLPILAAVFMAGSILFVKSLSRTEHPSAIVFYMNFIMAPLSLAPALFFWSWPSWPMLAVLVGLGLTASLSHEAVVRAYAKADASALMPLDYARLPIVAVLAYLLFGEVPSAWIWPGAAVIAGAALYIARREAQLARAPTAGAAPRALP